MKKPLCLVLIQLLAFAAVNAQSPAASSGAANSVQGSQPEQATPLIPQTRELKILAGTPLDIEAVYTVSSLDMRPGDFLSFSVLIPVKVEGVTLIDKDSLVTGRVVEAKRGGHWGKAGRLTWTMQDVVATDGTRVLLQAQKDLPTGQNGIKGTSHGGEVATKTVLTGVLLAPLFPIAPLALMNGFKRGENAVLPEGKRFVVYVQRDTNITVTAERSGP